MILHRPKTLDEWQAFFDGIFGKNNRRLNRKPRDFLERMSEILGYVTSTKHQQYNIDNYRWYYGKFLAWCCGFLTAQELKAHEVMGQKFPGVCPYCLNTTCVLNANPFAAGHTAIDRKAIAQKLTPQIRSKMRSYDLDKWREELFRIYSKNYHSGLDVFTDKVREELSELQYSFRRMTGASTETDRAAWTAALTDEIADVIAWYLGLGWHVFSRQPWKTLTPDLSLDEIVFASYQRGCPDCNHTECNCQQPDQSPRDSLSTSEVAPVRAPSLHLSVGGGGRNTVIIAGTVDFKQIESLNNSADSFIERLESIPALTPIDIEESRAMVNQILLMLSVGKPDSTTFETICDWFKRRGGSLTSRFSEFLRDIQANLVASGLWEIAKTFME